MEGRDVDSDRVLDPSFKMFKQSCDLMFFSQNPHQTRFIVLLLFHLTNTSHYLWPTSALSCPMCIIFNPLPYITMLGLLKCSAAQLGNVPQKIALPWGLFTEVQNPSSNINQIIITYIYIDFTLHSNSVYEQIIQALPKFKTIYNCFPTDLNTPLSHPPVCRRRYISMHTSLELWKLVFI